MDNPVETRTGQTPKSSRRRRGILLLILVVVAVGAGVGAYFLWWQKPALPGPDSPVYQEYVEAFQIGVAALDTGEYDLALKRLSEAIEKVPDEPAAWANRGLLHIRKNEPKEAADDLKQAKKLAPDSAEVDNLLGWLAYTRHRFPEAADHFRKALQHTPQDL